MAKIKILMLLFCVNILLRHCNCVRDEHQETWLALPNVKLGKDVLTAFKNIFIGSSQEQNLNILHKKIRNYDDKRELETLSTVFISALAPHHPELGNLDQNFADMLRQIDSINTDYGQYQIFIQLKKNASDINVGNFVHHATSPYRGTNFLMEKVYSELLPNTQLRGYTSFRDESIISLLTDKLKGYSMFCGQFKSQQQILQTILNGVGITEFKAFLIIDFSYKKLSEIKKADYNVEMNKVRAKFVERFERLTFEFKMYMAKASREVWTCSPEKYEEDKNYFQMNAFQSYVVRDSEFRNGPYISCAGSCSDHNNVKQTSCSNQEEYWDSDPGYQYYQYSICATTKRRCNGKLYGCSDRFDAYSQLWICPSEDNSTRRYEYMVHGYISIFSGRDLRRYGDPNYNKKCSRKYSYDYRSFDADFRICEVCLCTCQETESPTSDQKINIRPILADKDHVVTGIRWTKKKHALTLQIEQGKFSKGKVLSDTVHWKDTADPRNDSDVRLFDWQNFRGFYLQNVEVPKGKLLVGVRLKDMQFGNMKLVAPQLLSASVDEESGKLKYQMPFYNFPDKVAEYNDVWVPSPSTTREQHFSYDDAVNLGEGRVPTDFADEAVVVDSKKYVQLTTSDFRTDIGQNTVPYFEKAKIVAEPAIPLSGLGIYFKQNGVNSGGFLALKGLTMDESAYVKQKV